MRSCGRAAPAAGVGLCVLCCALLVSCALGTGGAGSAGGESGTSGAETADEHNPLGANGACYVCHMLFVREEISRTHLAAGVPCVRCHGASTGHANDEDIGATPPDRVFMRGDVNAACRKCHASHDVAPEDIVARWLSRRDRPTESAVCTDCHGAHRIAAAPAAPSE